MLPDLGEFRLADDPQKRAELVAKTLGVDLSRDRSLAREVSPVEMAAMIYYNRGVDLLGAKRFERAAVANAKALRLDPASTTARGNRLATINNWAIALGNANRFAEAVDLLRQELAFDPEYETFTANLLHVYHQWIEHLCEARKFDEALDVLARAAAELADGRYFRQAPADVYRRWAGTFFERDEPDGAFAVFDRARRLHGECRELFEAEATAINDRGLALLAEERFEDAVALFDRGLARQPDSHLLRENRRVAVMRWAEPAFQRGDYGEAIRRTTHGAEAGRLHDSLLNNVRHGYHQWIGKLKAAGERTEADRIAEQALADPYLKKADDLLAP